MCQFVLYFIYFKLLKSSIYLLWRLCQIESFLLLPVQHRRLVTLRIDFQSIPDDVPCDARIGKCGWAAALLLSAESGKTTALLERRDQARTSASRGGVAHCHMFGCYAFKGLCHDACDDFCKVFLFSSYIFLISFFSRYRVKLSR